MASMGPTGATGPTGSTQLAPPSFDSIAANTQQFLVTTSATYQQYLDLKAQRGTLLEQKANLAVEVRDKEQMLRELNRMEETYDEEFLERKGSPPKTSLTSIAGLHTTQDKAIASFYLAYVLFSLALTVYFIRVSSKKMLAAVFILTVLGVMGALITLGIVYYG
jgi:hypothetical protein